MAALPPIKPECSQQAALPSSPQSGNASSPAPTAARITQVAANSLCQLPPITANQKDSRISHLPDGTIKTTKVTYIANGVKETIDLMRLNNTRKTTEITKIKTPNGDIKTLTEIRETEKDGFIKTTREIKTEKPDGEIQLNKMVTEQELDGSIKTTETTYSTEKQGGITRNTLIQNTQINNSYAVRIEVEDTNWKDQYSTTRRIETETGMDKNGVPHTTRREIITETLPNGHAEIKEEVKTFKGKDIVTTLNSKRSTLTKAEEALLNGKQGLREEEMKSAALEKTPLDPVLKKNWAALEREEGSFDWTGHTITHLAPRVPEWN